jgi:hypothetical protein
MEEISLRTHGMIYDTYLQAFEQRTTSEPGVWILGGDGPPSTYFTESSYTTNWLAQFDNLTSVSKSLAGFQMAGIL